MKQLNSIGARRHFFRNSRRAMRPLRPGMSPDGLEDSPEMVPNHNNGFGYFSGKRPSLALTLLPDSFGNGLECALCLAALIYSHL